MKIIKGISLKPFTTFHIGGLSRYFCAVKNLKELKNALVFADQNKLKLLILGGGSNILISDQGFNGLVIKIEIKGSQLIAKNKYKFFAGENWDNVVKFAVKNNLWGIENLSHIPGNVGAFAVQNVGAYGQEASQVIEAVEALDLNTLKLKTFSNKDCKFSYRSSVFNKELKNKYVILSVVIKFSKIQKPNLSYGDLKVYFKTKKTINLKLIRKAIIQIRDKKFPFPKEPKNGSAGSFFKGPLLNKKQFINLNKKLEKLLSKQDLERFKSMIDKLRVPQGFKTPAGFLIEICGYAGLKSGGAVVNSKQAAIILNATGQAKARDVYNLFTKVKAGVFKKTGIKLEHEPEFIGFK